MSDNIARLFNENFPSNLNSKLLADLDEVTGKLDERKRLNYTSAENQEFRQSELNNITLRHWRESQAAAEPVKKKIEKFRANYEKEKERDVSRNLLELKRAENRLAVLDDEEIMMQASLYPYEAPADHIDALANELKKRGGDCSASFDILRDAMKKNHSSEPWRQTEEGAALLTELEISAAQYGEMRSLDDAGNVQKFDIAKEVYND